MKNDPNSNPINHEVLKFFELITIFLKNCFFVKYEPFFVNIFTYCIIFREISHFKPLKKERLITVEI